LIDGHTNAVFSAKPRQLAASPDADLIDGHLSIC